MLQTVNSLGHFEPWRCDHYIFANSQIPATRCIIGERKPKTHGGEILKTRGHKLAFVIANGAKFCVSACLCFLFTPTGELRLIE